MNVLLHHLRHILDVIILLSLFVILAISFSYLLEVYYHTQSSVQMPTQMKTPVQSHIFEQTPSLFSYLFSKDSAFSALGVAGIIAGLFGWIYRTISQRFSIVNSIASDIYSILRTSAALFVVQNIINMHRDVDCKSYAYLISRDEYSLVGRITLGDIGFLNQNAIKRINAFYITLKAYRDRAIMLAEWCKNNTYLGVIEPNRVKEFQSLTSTLIYYAFSCIENGRIALCELLGNSGLANEGIFLALAQDLRAITFLLEEEESGAIKGYVKRRLREKVEPLSKEK
jgi:hypothetical protein